MGYREGMLQNWYLLEQETVSDLPQWVVGWAHLSILFWWSQLEGTWASCVENKFTVDAYHSLYLFVVLFPSLDWYSQCQLKFKILKILNSYHIPQLLVVLLGQYGGLRLFAFQWSDSDIEMFHSGWETSRAYRLTWVLTLAVDNHYHFWCLMI